MLPWREKRSGDALAVIGLHRSHNVVAGVPPDWAECRRRRRVIVKSARTIPPGVKALPSRTASSMELWARAL